MAERAFRGGIRRRVVAPIVKARIPDEVQMARLRANRDAVIDRYDSAADAAEDMEPFRSRGSLDPVMAAGAVVILAVMILSGLAAAALMVW